MNQPPGLIIAVVMVLLLMVMSRLRSAQELTGVQSVRELFRSAARRLLEADPSPVDNDSQPEQRTGTAEPLWIMFAALGLVFAAEWLLQVFPPVRTAVNEFGLTPGGLRASQLGLTLFTIYIVLAVPLSELWWKRLTPDQAGVYLRSRFAGWLHRDLKAVERRKRRLRRKQARRLRRLEKHSSLKAD